ELARHGDRLLDGAHADYETEGILPVERGGNRGHPPRRELWPRIDQALAQAVEIAGKAADAVRIDAAQVGADAAARGEGSVLGRHVVCREQRLHECVGSIRRDIDALGYLGRMHGRFPELRLISGRLTSTIARPWYASPRIPHEILDRLPVNPRSGLAGGMAGAARSRRLLSPG